MSTKFTLTLYTSFASAQSGNPDQSRTFSSLLINTLFDKVHVPIYGSSFQNKGQAFCSSVSLNCLCMLMNGCFNFTTYKYVFILDFVHVQKLAILLAFYK